MKIHVIGQGLDASLDHDTTTNMHNMVARIKLAFNEKGMLGDHGYSVSIQPSNEGGNEILIKAAAELNHQQVISDVDFAITL